MITLPLIAALLLATSAAPAPPSPLPAQASLTPGLYVTWRPPPGQTRACVVRLRPPQEVLGCVEGRASSWRQGVASLEERFRVVAGDWVEVRAYDSQWGPPRSGVAEVAWRVWAPVVGLAWHSEAPGRR